MIGVMRAPLGSAPRGSHVRINIWIVLATLLALLVIIRYMQHQETPAICVDGPTAAVCHRDGTGWLVSYAFSIIENFGDAVRMARTRQKTSSSRIYGCLYRFLLPWRKPRWLRERRLPS